MSTFLLNPTTLGMAVAAFFLFQYWKVLPFMYHIRTISHLLWNYFQPALQKVDDPVVCSSSVRLCDMDWNGHMNSSVYGLEIDIMRYAWFSKFLRRKQGYYDDKFVANGGA